MLMTIIWPAKSEGSAPINAILLVELQALSLAIVPNSRVAICGTAFVKAGIGWFRGFLRGPEDRSLGRHEAWIGLLEWLEL